MADSTYCWIRNNDFRESRCAQHSKYRFGIMAFGAIGKNFRSKIVSPKGRITAEVYQNYLKESEVFVDADKNFGKFNYYFQLDNCTSHITIASKSYFIFYL